MTLQFKSIGHFLATVFQNISKGLVKVEATEKGVEGVTAEIPKYGPLALPVEKAAYALLGEVSALILAGDAAAVAKLNDVGLDTNVIATVEAVAKSGVSLASVVKTI